MRKQFISNPLIKPETIETRLYQETLLGTADKGNTLIVAPTAIGKTIIAVLLAAKKLNENKNKKIVFLAPTKPLITQHRKSFCQFLTLEEEKIVAMSGTTPPKKREEIWSNAQIICATPETMRNDILSKRIDLNSIQLLIFDECHHAVGDYAYVIIAEEYTKIPSHHLLGLTASPGSNNEKVEEICKNLKIDFIEIKNESDDDVKPYVNPIHINWIRLDLPEGFLKVKKYLEETKKARLKWLIQNQMLSIKSTAYVKKKDILGLSAKLRTELSGPSPSPEHFTAISYCAALLKIFHALELLLTQGIEPLEQYFHKLELQSKKTKAVKMLLSESNMRNAITLVRWMRNKKIEHPKLKKLSAIVEEECAFNPKSKFIIFTQYRATVNKIVKYLENKNIKAKKFVGQAGKDGLSQKKQAQVIENFRNNEFSVLVATSVGEEGLDLPSVDTVIFYEPIPSEIRTIQRRGRTGRHSTGKMIGLIAKDTMDESYYWASTHKEKNMKKNIKGITSSDINIKQADKSQKKIDNFDQDKKKAKIYVDIREVGGSLIRELSQDPVIDLISQQLSVGDFLVSPRVVVERKTANDFLQSIIDGRLMKQAVELGRNYSSPIIIIEGKNLYNIRNIHPNAIRGAIVTLTIDFNIPIIFTDNEKDTAQFLIRIAKREQLETDKNVQVKGKRKADTLVEKQELLVCSLPKINIKLGHRLLHHFKSLDHLFNASQKDLLVVEGIGPKLSKEIFEITHSEFKLRKNEIEEKDNS